MCVDDLVIFGASNDMYVTVGNYDGFGVIREVLKLLKLLNFIVFVLDIVQKAVVFLDGEDGQPCDRFVEVVVEGDDEFELLLVFGFFDLGQLKRIVFCGDRCAEDFG